MFIPTLWGIGGEEGDWGEEGGLVVRRGIGIRRWWIGVRRDG